MSKSTIIILVIIVAAAGGYFYFFGSQPAESGSLLQADADAETAAIGAQVLSLLNQTQSLTIDAAFFTSPVYQTFRDFSVAIPPTNVGRANPFAPLPGVTRAEN